MSGFVYLRSEPGLWTVGFYAPGGEWHSESDHPTAREASERAAWLNGSGASQCNTREIVRASSAFHAWFREYVGPARYTELLPYTRELEAFERVVRESEKAAH